VVYLGKLNHVEKVYERKTGMQLLNRTVQRGCGVVDFLLHIPTKSRFFLHSVGKTRRFFLVHCRRRYVQRQLVIRKGACRQCGTCCNLLFTCPMLSNGGRCFAYGTCRPQVCKVFPIDERDIREIGQCGKQCGYFFLEENE